MWINNFLIFLYSFVFLKWKIVSADDFPSLLMSNASIAIILDREYLDTQYDISLAETKIIIERVLREDLKNGGLIVTYYSWTSINFKKDFTAVFSVTNCKETWKVFKRCREETLVLMALSDPDCPRLPPHQAIMIPLMNIGEELPQVVLDMKSGGAFNWKSAVVLHDETFGRDIISRVVTALSSESPDGYVKPLTISMFKVRSHTHEWERRKSIRKTLSNLPIKFVGSKFIAVVTTSLMETLLEISKDLGMVNTFTEWLYVVSDTNALSNNISSVISLISEGENIAFAFNITTTSPECVYGINCHAGELLKSFVLGISRMIREEKAVYGQISDEEWEAIRPTKRERKDTILNFMRGYLKDNSKCSNCTTWRMQSGESWGNVYDTKFSSISTLDDFDDFSNLKPKVKLLQSGYWKPSIGVDMQDALFPHIAHGFRNKELHIITYHNPPWQIISYNGNGEAQFKGVVINILNELSKKLNFTYVFHISVAESIILANDTDSLSFNTSLDVHLPTVNIPTDILNVIGNNRVLMAATGVTVNNRYKNLINFTIPISIQPYNFLVSRPRELSRIYLFLSPFTTETWICIGFSIAFMSPLLYAINRLSPFYEFYGIKQQGGLHTLNNCFWYIYGALLQQGGMYLPRADSGRLIIGTWWLVVLIVVTTYCGNLVAYLTFPKIEIPITTINQLIRHQSSISWGLKSGSYLEEYLKETDEPKHKRLFDGAFLHTQETSDIIENVRNGKHVYIDWKSNLQYIMKREFLETDRCDFALGNDDFFEEQIALILPKNSPYLNLINEEIKKLHQMGFIQRWLTEYLPKRDKCWNTKISNEIVNHTVNIFDMQGSFMVLLFGVVGAFFLIIIECLWHRHTVSRDKKIIKPFVD